MENLELEVGIDVEVEFGQSVDDILDEYSDYNQICFVERYKSGKIRKQTTYAKIDGEFEERIILGWHENGSLASSLIYSETNEEYIRWGWDRKGNIMVECYFGGEISDRKLIERMYGTDLNGKNVLEKIFVDGELV